MLKQKLLLAVASVCAMMLVSTSLSAQYDDMYYDPDEFRSTETSRGYYDDADDDYDRISGQEQRSRVSSNYDDDYYDYYYSSRIRRFNRPYRGFGYYDPVYVDMAYYDPFFRPAGTTVLIYNGYGGFNRFNNFNRWGYGANPFVQPVLTPYGVRYVDTRFGGINRSWGDPFYRGFNDPFYGNAYAGGFGRGYYGAGAWGRNIGYNGFGGVGGAYYCPPAWGAGNTYAVSNNVNNATSRPVTNVSRASTVSIADRVDRARQNRAVTTRSAGSTQRAVAPGTTQTSRAGRSIDRTRTTVQPRTNATTTRRAVPSRATTPQQRTYTPTRRSTTPQRAVPSRTPNTRTYTPTRRTTTPNRSYTPSRSPSPSAMPSRSSGSSTRSATPTRSSGGGRTPTPTRRGGGTE